MFESCPSLTGPGEMARLEKCVHTMTETCAVFIEEDL